MEAHKLDEAIAEVVDIRAGVSGDVYLAEKEKEAAEARAVLKKFKGARKIGSRWESELVTWENAADFDADPGPNGTVIDVYALVKPLNREAVRVYSTTEYRFTAHHMAEFACNNKKQFIKQMVRIFKIQ